MTADLSLVAEATWPPAAETPLGPWTIRDGQGGGKRVSAATAHRDWSDGDIPIAERAMAALGQAPLFMLRAGDAPLDAALAARGYREIDPVWVYRIAISHLGLGPLPHATAFALWPPLAIQRELWAEGGIGPARLAVMARAKAPKAAILGRAQDRPAGTAFVACHGTIAMIHAIEVRPSLRRHGVGRNMLLAAARWAHHQGASDLTLLVTKANAAANALYTSLGMQSVGDYHYRLKDSGWG